MTNPTNPIYLESWWWDIARREHEIDEIQSVFFDGMQHCYLGSAPRIDVPGRPKFRRVEYVDGMYRFQDEYQKTLGNSYSFGSICIWKAEMPIWGMSYSGYFDRGALPFLKHALRSSYEKRKFIGGRGPVRFRSELFPDLEYENNQCRWEFDRFEGYETIYDWRAHKILGSAKYHGHAV